MIKASLATYLELSKLTSVFYNVYHYEAFYSCHLDIFNFQVEIQSNIFYGL